LLVSDPPFGVNYDPAWRNEAGVSSTTRTGRVLNDHRADYHHQHEPCLYAVREGETGHWQGALDKTTPWSIATRGDAVEDPETVHGTRRPLECMRRPILNNNSAPGDAIYEPFSGGGTTIIAAQATNRVCHTIEINPAYCDVAVRRWQDLTGKLAPLDGDYESFDDLDATRTRGEAARTSRTGAVGRAAVHPVPQPSHAREPAMPARHLALFVIMHNRVQQGHEAFGLHRLDHDPRHLDRHHHAVGTRHAGPARAGHPGQHRPRAQHRDPDAAVAILDRQVFGEGDTRVLATP
jgi:hypothetical protein